MMHASGLLQVQATCGTQIIRPQQIIKSENQQQMVFWQNRNQ